MSSETDLAEDLAENESYDVLVSALYSALEADLSSNGWPGNSKAIFAEAFESLESLVAMVDA